MDYLGFFHSLLTSKPSVSQADIVPSIPQTQPHFQRGPVPGVSGIHYNLPFLTFL